MRITKMTNDSSADFFRDDPWELIEEPCYPHARRLYLNDDRFWVSMDDHSQILFFIQDQGADEVEPLKNVAGLDVSVEKIGLEQRLVCRLTSQDTELIEKFSTVAKDIAFYCSEYKGVRIFLKAQERIKSWANFLKPTRDGLSTPEFVGLLGELYVLSEHLMPAISAVDAVRSWIGPEHKKQDFNFNKVAIEVKTTLSGERQVVRISSLDQLEKVTNELFLIRVVATPASDKGGFSLGQLYDRCTKAAEHDLISNSLFLQKATPLYSQASESQIRDRYVVNSVSIFRVDDEFPKLTRSNVRLAIREANYEISLEAMKKFEVSTSVREVVANG